MRVFIYEFITGGGLLAKEGEISFPPSLLAEGSAMLAALVADFLALDNVCVTVLRDYRLSGWKLPGCEMVAVATAAEESSCIEKRAALADWTVVIAPEFSEQLWSKCRLVEQAGGRLLGPSSEIVKLAGDKQAMAEHLAAAGVPVPQGRLVAPGEPWPLDFPYPAVAKPCDGAGSLGMRLVETHTAQREGVGSLFRGTIDPNGEGEPEKDSRPPGSTRLERFHPGIAASVAFLCGPTAIHALAPCRQRLSEDGRFTYLGGSLPLEPGLAQRAARLAARAIDTLPKPLGYLGVDLVLDENTDGSNDVVIEINPRLTTSYVGLRAAASENLAGAMLVIAEGQHARLSFQPDRVEFDADGTVRRAGVGGTKGSGGSGVVFGHGSAR